MAKINPALVAFNQRSRERSNALQALLEDDEIVRGAATDFLKENQRIEVFSTTEARDTAFKCINSFSSIVLQISAFQPRFTSEREKANKASNAQKRRAQSERILLDGIALKERIRREISRPERRDEIAKELWPHVVSMINEYGSVTKEIRTARDPKSWSILYEYDRHFLSAQNCDGKTARTEKPRRLTYINFRRMVAEIRKENVSRATN